MSYFSSVYSFSGPDCSGKSTQIEFLYQTLIIRNERPFVLWTRLGYTPGFEYFKRLVRKFGGKTVPSQDSRVKRDILMGNSLIRHVWLFFALIDLFLTLSIRSRLILFRGHCLILDRWFWDSLIDFRLYHKGPIWLEPILVFLYSLFCLKPHSQFLLDIPFNVALERSLLKEEPFPDTDLVRRCRHQLYDQLALKSDFVVCSALLPVDELFDFVLSRT